MGSMGWGRQPLWRQEHAVPGCHSGPVGLVHPESQSAGSVHPEHQGSPCRLVSERQGLLGRSPPGCPLTTLPHLTYADEDNPLPDLLDPITLEPVVRPAISPYGHVMGMATWKVGGCVWGLG